MRSVRWFSLVLAGVLVLGGVACSSDDTDSEEPVGGDQFTEPVETTSETTSEPATEDGTLTISGSTFVPGEVVTASGGALTVVNEDGIDHTFTMDDGSLDEPVAGGATVDVTVTEGGPFHCAIHPSMTGTVTLG